MDETYWATPHSLTSDPPGSVYTNPVESLELLNVDKRDSPRVVRVLRTRQMLRCTRGSSRDERRDPTLGHNMTFFLYRLLPRMCTLLMCLFMLSNENAVFQINKKWFC